jgi:ankyrin repeat protein
LETDQDLPIVEARSIVKSSAFSPLGLLEEAVMQKSTRASLILLDQFNIDKQCLSELLLEIVQDPEEEGSVELARQLIVHGANPDSCDPDGNTCLHVSYESMATSYEMFECIAKNANVNAINADGDTVLHHAIQINDVDTTIALLYLGADPNQTDGNGQLPLVTAAHITESNHCLKALLHYGADLNALDESGRTALSYIENPAASLVLLENGARSDMCDDQGVTPLHTALATWSRWRRGESLGMILFGATKLAEQLFLQSDNIDMKDHFGRTPLHYACEVPWEPASQYVQALVSSGAHVNAVDKNGWTPLMVAVALGNYTTAITLVGLGAKVDCADSMGRTVMDLIGLSSAVGSCTSIEAFADSVRQVAFGGEAPPRRFVAPLSEATCSKYTELMVSSSRNDTYHRTNVEALEQFKEVLMERQCTTRTTNHQEGPTKPCARRLRIHQARDVGAVA